MFQGSRGKQLKIMEVMHLRWRLDSCRCWVIGSAVKHVAPSLLPHIRTCCDIRFEVPQRWSLRDQLSEEQIGCHGMPFADLLLGILNHYHHYFFLCSSSRCWRPVELCYWCSEVANQKTVQQYQACQPSDSRCGLWNHCHCYFVAAGWGGKHEISNAPFSLLHSLGERQKMSCDPNDGWLFWLWH